MTGRNRRRTGSRIFCAQQFYDATFKQRTANGVANIDTATLLRDKKAVLFGPPGVYTPDCSAYHLAGFVAKADDLKAKGIDAIACISVDDPSPDLRKLVPN